MPTDATKINHITDELLSTAPSFPQVAEHLINMITNISTPQDIVIFLVLHGEQSATPILADEFINNNIPIPENWRFADTLPMFRSLIPNAGPKNSKPYSLESLYHRFFKHPATGSHRAMGDVIVLESCLRAALTPSPESNFSADLIKTMLYCV